VTDSLEPSDQSPGIDPQTEDDTLTGHPRLTAEPVRKRHRTWPQRLVLTFNSVLVVACLGAAVIVYYGNEKANDRKVVSILGAEGGPTLTLPTTTTPIDPETGEPSVTEPPVPVDLTAKNFLITGTDNGACVDPDSPYAATFGNRNGLGERADTLMILRLDPKTNAAAVLSFPRDLWVRINGKKTQSRINSAFNRDDPNPLIVTIFDNFGILIDHYVNIDFCAFKEIVDAVGGVRVPFATPVKDKNTNLLIEQAGCHTFGGEEGLAYVRSRHFRYYDAKSKKWIEDPAADRGRISRQQDFLRRAIQKALDKSAGNPTIAKDLIDAALKYVILDVNLTAGKLLELASAMKNLDASTMKTYQIEGSGKMVGELSVIEPRLKTDNMKAVLAVFQGRARLVDAPEQIFEVATTTIAPTTTVASTTTAATTPASTAVGETVPPTTKAPKTTTTTSTTPTTLVPVYVESNSVGILPTNDPACR
jgi:LCP family protein required for cell wall assembly